MKESLDLSALDRDRPAVELTGFWGGMVASSIAAFGTAAGSLVLFLRRRWSERQQVWMLAAAAGVMLGATLFSLLLPALDDLSTSLGSTGGALVAGAMVLTGALAVSLLHQIIPHEHAQKGREGPRSPLGRHTLFIFAIALHNIPEGLSVGVASGVELSQGLPVLLGITAQNLPEGFAVAAALLNDGAKRAFAVGIGALTGLAEVLGGGVGAAAVGLGEAVVPYAYGFAAGAMLFIISGEVIPETHAAGKETAATHAMMVGFVLMMLLTVLLG